jgi:hypothetical protein
MLTASVQVKTPDEFITIAATLPKLTATIRVKKAIGARFAVHLPRLQAATTVRNKARIASLTGEVRAGGSALLAFLGPPDRSIEWSIVEGGGQLLPITDYTDQYGRASCMYDTGGFVGDVVIQVEYGA